MRPTLGGPDLLSAVPLISQEFGGSLWIGGYKDPSTSTWAWTDGTSASNLNCGFAGCGMFADGQPK